MKRVVAMISLLSIVGSVALDSTALAGPWISKDESGSGCGEQVEPTRTFEVKLRVLKDEYRIGEKARFKVRVHRVVRGQDLGPVEGVRVALGVELGEVNLWSVGVTGPHGRTSIKAALKSYVPTGRADVVAMAEKPTGIHLPCSSRLEYEYGDVSKRRLFRVVR